MGKTLVLTEKPSVGRDIAKVLGCRRKDNGCYIGEKYIVTWALGHLVTLSTPETYDKRYKFWRLEDLPMIPKKMELAVIKDTAKHFSTVKKIMKSNDINDLIIATDSGREGELVARWIIEKAGFKKPLKRLWISSQTDQSIREGFANLKPGEQYVNLYKSAQCRAEADWLIGLNVTRALTCKYNAQLSAGRVQTPTLAIIVQRENEIKNFIPKEYWTVEAKVKGFTLQWKDKNTGQNRINDIKKAEDIVKSIKGKTGRIIDIKKEDRKELPPLAYDLTELQRDANKKFNYSAKQTLSIMQRLYEQHKVLTYPRTDSRYITDDIVPTLTIRLKSIAVGAYAPMVSQLNKNGLSITKRLVDNKKVSDHHAIIPTEQFVDLNKFSREERNIYDLVVKRFIAILSQPFEYEQTTVNVDVENNLFYAKGKVVTSMGWKSIYENSGQGSGVNAQDVYDSINNDMNDENEDDKHQELPQLEKGKDIKIISSEKITGKTKPPARYTEATLLSAMERPGKFIDDKNLKKTLENTTGLGTPATRADIIEKLFNTGYIEKKGKSIFPTSKGIQLIDIVPHDLKSPELTAKWEQQLELISKGKENPENYISDMKTYSKRLVSDVIKSSANFKHDNLTKNKCPDCGKFLLEIKGKKGKFHICQDRECGYRSMISQLSNARCPQCHKKMELKGEGDNKTFFCSCGFREKLQAFNKRKEKNNKTASKRDAYSYMKKQDVDTPINSAMADALKKWKNQQN